MNDRSNNAITRGAHHIGLTVPNLRTTCGFFIDTLGFEQIGDIPDYPAVFLNRRHHHDYALAGR